MDGDRSGAPKMMAVTAEASDLEVAVGVQEVVLQEDLLAARNDFLMACVEIKKQKSNV